MAVQHFVEFSFISLNFPLSFYYFLNEINLSLDFKKLDLLLNYDDDD